MCFGAKSVLFIQQPTHILYYELITTIDVRSSASSVKRGVSVLTINDDFQYRIIRNTQRMLYRRKLFTFAIQMTQPLSTRSIWQF